MSWSLINHGVAGSSDAISATVTLDTTGATLIVVGGTYSTGNGPATFSDAVTANSAKWTKLNTNVASGANETSNLWYIQNPTTNASHAITISGGSASVFPSIYVLVFSGTGFAPLDVQAGNFNGAGSTSLTAGTVTPAVDGELIVTIAQINGTPTGQNVTTSGFTTQDTLAQVAGKNYGGGIAFKILGAGTAGTAVTPSWSWTTTSSNSDASTATFRLGAAITDNLVAYYKFSDISGTNAPDATGNGNDGTTQNSPTTAAGKGDGAIVLNGSSQYISLPANSDLNTTGAISMAAWIKTSNAGIQLIIGGYQDATPFPGYGFIVGFPNPGNNSYWSGAWGAWVAGTNTVNDGNWHHVVVSVTGTGATFYLDGAANGAQTTQQPSFFNGLRAIGAVSDGTSNFFNGSLSGVGIWTRTLSLGEAFALYNAGAGLAYPFTTIGGFNGFNIAFVH